MNKETTMNLRHNVSLVVASVLFVTTGAMADGLFSNGRFSIGAGVGYASAIYRGDKADTGIAPFLSYESDRLQLDLGGIGYKVFNSDDLQLSLHIAAGEEPDFPKNNPLFAGLKRGTPVEIGFDVTRDFGGFYVGGGMMYDASSEHKGYHAELVIGTEIDLGPVMVDIGGGARVRDRKLNNFLYGVSAAEANGNRSAYDVGRTTEPFIDMTMSYAISDNVALIGVADYHFLNKKVQNSPLTRDRDAYSVAFGMIYSF
jgi:outer membrane scaffolding protein for murein synthesis (MipA/OmpV family)